MFFDGKRGRSRAPPLQGDGRNGRAAAREGTGARGQGRGDMASPPLPPAASNPTRQRLVSAAWRALPASHACGFAAAMERVKRPGPRTAETGLPFDAAWRGGRACWGRMCKGRERRRDRAAIWCGVTASSMRIMRAPPAHPSSCCALMRRGIDRKMTRGYGQARRDGL